MAPLQVRFLPRLQPLALDCPPWAGRRRQGLKIRTMKDFFEEEAKLAKKLFDLDEVLEVQRNHDVQIIRGEDYNYLCYIDKKGYGVSLTPMLALALGVKQFKECTT